MRVVVGVDWTEERLSGVEEVLHLYAPQELGLVHAVNLGALESHALVPSMEQQAYDDLRRAKQLAREAACQPLDQIASRVEADVPSVRQVCEVGSPASLILDTAQSAGADLVVVGHRGLGQVAELAMGSVSHRVLLNATCSTLVVKGSPRKPQRVLVAVEGSHDMARIQTWLIAHPFKHSVNLVVMSVVPQPQVGKHKGTLKFWTQAAFKGAQGLVNNMAAVLNGPHYAATGHVANGDPATVIAQEASRFDLLVVSSHGRKGLHRFLLGSVSHSLVHRAPCPVLVVR